MSRSRYRYLSPSPTAWNPPFTEDGAQSKAVFHLSARKSGHLALCPRCWTGSPTNQMRAWIVPHLKLLLTTLQDQVGHGAPEIDHAAVPKVSPQPTAGDQALWALQLVITPSAPMPLKAARNQAANLNSPTMQKTPPMKMRMLRQTRVKPRLQATVGQHPMVKRGKNTLKLKTPSPVLAKSSVSMRTPTQSLTLVRRSSPSSRSSGNQAPRRTAPQGIQQVIF